MHLSALKISERLNQWLPRKSYITKSQRGMSELLRTAAKEVQKTCSTVKEQLRKVSNQFLNSVEIGAPEAAYICLQLPLKRSSRSVIFVNTNIPEKRVFLLKPKSVLSNMDDDDEDIKSKDLINKYQDRPDDLK